MKFPITIILVFIAFEFKAQDLHALLTTTNKVCEKGSAAVSIVSGSPPYIFAWSTGDTGDEVSGLEAGNYSVTLTDNHAHDTTFYFSITEDVCEPGVANHFTPNGDDFNDRWSISGLNYFPDFELIVYNRWGQRVHYQTGQYIPWDGTNLGLPLPDATYYYIIFLSRGDTSKTMKGDVSIIR